MPETGRRLTARSRRRLRLAAGLTAVAIIAAAANPHEAPAAVCPGQTAEPAKTSMRQVALATRCLINAERRTRGLRILRSSGRLSKAARRHSRDMARQHYFSHRSPDGTTFPERVRRTGYLHAANDWLVGENLAWGTRASGTARQIVRMWMASPSHRRVLLTRSFRDVGLGVEWGVPDRQLAGGATYTVNFGVRY
jgi:uncharacterized protein YkwD